MGGRNPKYDGLRVYRLDIAKLQSGDVLLTRNAETNSSIGKLQSRGIMRATGGNFSHALLCTVPPTFIEAIGQGVSNLSGQVCFVHDLKNVRLLRYHNPLIAQNAGSEALPLLGQAYSIRKAIRSILPTAELSEVPDNKLFCSALVAAAFKKAGAPEFEKLDPMKVTPATLEKGPYFIDVTDAVFVQVLSPSNIEEMSAFDGERVESPLGDQAGLFHEFAATLLPMIQEFVDMTPELTFTKMPTNFLECVMFIGAAQSACGELPGEISIIAKARLSVVDAAAYGLLSDGRYEEMHRKATARDEESLRYTIEQSFQAAPDIDLEDTRGVIAATRQQIASRSGLLGDNDRMAETRTTRKWFEITGEVVETLKRRLMGLEEAFRRAFPGKSY